MTHQEKCLNPECDCSSIDINELKSLLKGIKNKEKNDPFITYQTFEIVVYVIENELINYISSLPIKKKLTNYLHIIVLYCNFVYYFKRNDIYALYLIDEYLNNIKSITMEYKIYLLSLKNTIVKSYYKETNLIKHNNSFIVHYELFINYFNRINSIHACLVKSCLYIFPNNVY